MPVLKPIISNNYRKNFIIERWNEHENETKGRSEIAFQCKIRFFIRIFKKRYQ